MLTKHLESLPEQEIRRLAALPPTQWLAAVTAKTVNELRDDVRALRTRMNLLMFRLECKKRERKLNESGDNGFAVFQRILAELAR